MKGVPVPSILTLWAMGYSAAIIEQRLKVPRKTVTRMVALARQKRDPRAVLHHHANGRVVGNLAKCKAIMVAWPEIKIVQVKELPR